jgi:hypothetical protein
MKKSHKIISVASGVVLGILLLTAGASGCSDSDKASQNISTEAEQFRIQRQIVFYNGITDSYIATVVGRCSVDPASDLPGKTLAVTCKEGADKYVKHYLGLSDNTTWFALQTKPVAVDVYHTEIVFKPAAILPYVNGEFGNNGATGNSGLDEDTSGIVTTTPGAPAPVPSPAPTK